MDTLQAAHDKSHAVMPNAGGIGVKKHSSNDSPNAEALAAVDADMVTISMPDVVLMLAISAAHGEGGLLAEARAAAACAQGTTHPLTAALKYLAKLNYVLPVYCSLVEALKRAVELQQKEGQVEEEEGDVEEEEQVVEEEEQVDGEQDVGFDGDGEGAGSDGESDEEEFNFDSPGPPVPTPVPQPQTKKRIRRHGPGWVSRDRRAKLDIPPTIAEDLSLIHI